MDITVLIDVDLSHAAPAAALALKPGPPAEDRAPAAPRLDVFVDFGEIAALIRQTFRRARGKG